MMTFIFKNYPACRLAMIYVLISTWLVIGAFFMQIFFGLQPCDLCVWQRIPHLAVMFGAVLVPLKFVRFTLIMQAMAYFINAALALYHTGIERLWWKGIGECVSPEINQLSINDLYQKLMMTNIVKCNEISFSLFGLSLTNYNLIVCTLLGISLIYAIRGYDAQRNI